MTRFCIKSISSYFGLISGTLVTYIPDNNSARPPANTALNILAECDMVEEEFQKEIRFFLLKSNNVASDFIISVVSVYVDIQEDGACLHCGFT